MIYYGSFRDINEKYDEIWLIVRSLKTIPKGKNIIHVPVLSPSNELFHDYMNWKSQGQWNKDTFENLYKPRFLKEMESPKCIEMLNTLKEKGKKSNILLVCYCKEESICHRSIIKEIIKRSENMNNSYNDFYLLIAGSRYYNDYEEMSRITDHMISNHKNDTIHIISGGAKGADALAKRYALEHNYYYYEFQAEWNKDGKSAGYKRNKRMHDYISKFQNRGCLCFWDGNSKGTAHNFELSKENQTPLKVFVYPTKKWISL